MARENFTSTFNIHVITRKLLILLFISDLSFSYTYPLFGGKRYLRSVPLRRSYQSLPMNRMRDEYQLPEYDEGFMPTTQEDYEYNLYEKYPLVQYFGYYPGRNYYHDKVPRRGMDGFDYFEDQVPPEFLQNEMVRRETGDFYPYGQETWYEEELPKFEKNSEANAAFLQNLIMAQMYQDARNQYPYGYEVGSNDYDDQHWFYGVPTTEVDDKEKVKQYFKNKEDEDVKTLESLARKKEKSKKLKDKETHKKQKSAEIEKATKSKSKMTDDEYFDMQKQIIVNGRKNGFGLSDGFRLNKKQIYDQIDPRDNFWNFHQSRMGEYPEGPINSVKKINLIKNDKDTKAYSDNKLIVESSTASAPSTKRPPAVLGQKEVVLPRPSISLPRPYGEISSRSPHQPTVYDTIKQLLNMEKDLQKSDLTSQPQKRYVLNEDQLTAELSGLKRKST